MSLIASQKLAPTELVELLLQFSSTQLTEQPFGPLVLVVRVPSDDDTGQFLHKLTASVMKDVPITGESQRWPVTSHFPTMKVESREFSKADQVELLSVLSNAPHCIVPLRANKKSSSLLIGRAPHCDIIFSDPSISAEHARIEIEDGGVRLIDAQSKNGTYLNDQRLLPSERSWLQPMDRITLGRVHAFSCDARVLRGVLRQDLRTIL